jgi:hypothetical protein
LFPIWTIEIPGELHHLKQEMIEKANIDRQSEMLIWSKYRESNRSGLQSTLSTARTIAVTDDATDGTQVNKCE